MPLKKDICSVAFQWDEAPPAHPAPVTTGLHPGLALRGCGPQFTPLQNGASLCLLQTSDEALNSQTPTRTLQSLCSQANESCVGGGNAQVPLSCLPPEALDLGPALRVCPPPPAWASALLL